MSDLKSCPYCGHCPQKAVQYLSHDGEMIWVISCENDNCQFDMCIEHEDKDEAIRRWNALPRPLRWTKETPTDPGWYWFRNLSKPQIVHTSGIKNRKPHPADEWAGPIQEPEE